MENFLNGELIESDVEKLGGTLVFRGTTGAGAESLRLLGRRR